jgi:hypothetical protein
VGVYEEPPTVIFQRFCFEFRCCSAVCKMNGTAKKKKVVAGGKEAGPRTVLKRASLKTGPGVGAQLNSFEDEDMYQEPIKQVVRPANQLDLTEAELKEEHTRVLTATDPNGEFLVDSRVSTGTNCAMLTDSLTCVI